MTGCSMMFMLHPPAVRMAHDGTMAGPRPGGPGVRGVLPTSPTCYSFCASAPGGMPEASHNSELHTAHHGTMIWRIRTGQLIQTFSDTSASEIPALLGMTTSQHLNIIYIYCMYIYIYIYTSKRNPTRMDLRIEGTQVTHGTGPLQNTALILPQV